MADSEHRSYSSGQLITEWSTGYSGTVLQGGVSYQNGYITVPQTGLYYIYFQLWIDPQLGNSAYSGGFLQLNDKSIGGVYSYINGSPSRHQDRTSYTAVYDVLQKETGYQSR